MFLTKLTLDPTAYRPQRLLRDTQQLHAAISASFPGGESGRVLWRAEQPRGGDVVILVASPRGPNDAELSERITTADRAATRPYQGLLDRIEKGDYYRFRATLNPVRRRHHTRHGLHGDHPILDRQAQTSWVAQKLASNGATVLAHSADLDNDEPDVQITSTVHDKFPHRSSTGHIELLKVTFEGSLQVSNPDALRHILCNGVGHGKAYGCGLITLASEQRLAHPPTL
jgi:CRISPR system Cascade subunit CasE